MTKACWADKFPCYHGISIQRALDVDDTEQQANFLLKFNASVCKRRSDV